MNLSFVIEKEHVLTPAQIRMLDSLPTDKAWRVTAEEHKAKHTRDQEDYLWGKVYPDFIKGGGEQLRGWSKKALHNFLLGEHFGTKTLTIGRLTYHEPLRGSSGLAIDEYSAYIEFIFRYAASLGIVISDPEST
jgi:hypothetical protein